MSPQGASLAAHVKAIRQIRVAIREHNPPALRWPAGNYWSPPDFVCVDCGNQFRSVLSRPCCPRCASDEVRVS